MVNQKRCLSRVLLGSCSEVTLNTTFRRKVHWTTVNKHLGTHLMTKPHFLHILACLRCNTCNLLRESYICLCTSCVQSWTVVQMPSWKVHSLCFRSCWKYKFCTFANVKCTSMAPHDMQDIVCMCISLNDLYICWAFACVCNSLFVHSTHACAPVQHQGNVVTHIICTFLGGTVCPGHLRQQLHVSTVHND